MALFEGAAVEFWSNIHPQINWFWKTIFQFEYFPRFPQEHHFIPCRTWFLFGVERCQTGVSSCPSTCFSRNFRNFSIWMVRKLICIGSPSLGMCYFTNKTFQVLRDEFRQEGGQLLLLQHQQERWGSIQGIFLMDQLPGQRHLHQTSPVSFTG